LLPPGPSGVSERPPPLLPPYATASPRSWRAFAFRFVVCILPVLDSRTFFPVQGLLRQAVILSRPGLSAGKLDGERGQRCRGGPQPSRTSRFCGAAARRSSRPPTTSLTSTAVSAGPEEGGAFAPLSGIPPPSAGADSGADLAGPLLVRCRVGVFAGRRRERPGVGRPPRREWEGPEARIQNVRYTVSTTGV